MNLEIVVPLVIAARGGAVVGLERQWSGHADGPAARFAGIRTFTLLGLLGAIAGLAIARGFVAPASVLLAGAVGLVIAAYAAASRADVDGTTEVAALVVLSAGAIAGTGEVVMASALVAVTGVLLAEKTRLHTWSARIDGVDLRAGLRFAAMALVILPLLPSGPHGPGIGVRPRELWALVLFFSGLSFAGHIARKALGRNHGLALVGAIGGLVSSTNVTLTFARASREDAAAGHALGAGALAASTVLFPRVLAATVVLNPPLAWVLAPMLVPAFAVAAAATAASLWWMRGGTAPTTPTANPLKVGAALQMAVLFQVVLYGVDLAQRSYGQAGLLASGAVLGLTDVDALTVTMARGAHGEAGPAVAAVAIIVGVLANTLLKAGLALTLGSRRFRLICGVGLLTMALALGATLAAR